MHMLSLTLMLRATLCHVFKQRHQRCMVRRSYILRASTDGDQASQGSPVGCAVGKTELT